MGSNTSLTLALALVGVLMTPPADAATPAGAWILRCQVEGAARTFRVAPKLLQERRSPDGRFGPNLCETFACTADRDRLEGVISSASLILTLQIDRRTGQGSWSTVGASNHQQTSGPCQADPEKLAVKPG